MKLASVAAFLVAAMLLAGCGKSEPPRRSEKLADFKVSDLAGVWAWNGVENCWNNGNTIHFQHRGGSSFVIEVSNFSNVHFEVPDAKVTRALAAGKPQLTVHYALQGRDYEEVYQPSDVNRLRVVRSTVNGESQKLASIEQPDRVLVRCNATRAPVPEK